MNLLTLFGRGHRTGRHAGGRGAGAHTLFLCGACPEKADGGVIPAITFTSTATSRSSRPIPAPPTALRWGHPPTISIGGTLTGSQSTRAQGQVRRHQLVHGRYSVKNLSDRNIHAFTFL